MPDVEGAEDASTSIGLGVSNESSLARTMTVAGAGGVVTGLAVGTAGGASFLGALIVVGTLSFIGVGFFLLWLHSRRKHERPNSHAR